jgi:hypothetical protein
VTIYIGRAVAWRTAVTIGKVVVMVAAMLLMVKVNSCVCIYVLYGPVLWHAKVSIWPKLSFPNSGRRRTQLQGYEILVEILLVLLGILNGENIYFFKWTSDLFSGIIKPVAINKYIPLCFGHFTIHLIGHRFWYIVESIAQFIIS